jgi:hypothetical protein
MQNSWASVLNPFIANPFLNGILLKNISLSSGDNTINHKLGRNLQGWVLVRKRQSVDIYDKQDTNQMPDLTLVLNASATATIDLYVF